MKSKKIIAFATAVLSVCVCASSAFAYVFSPSYNKPSSNKGVKSGATPTTTVTETEESDGSSDSSSSVSTEESSENYVITAYGDKSKLSKARQKRIEAAYKAIAESVSVDGLFTTTKTTENEDGEKTTETVADEESVDILEEIAEDNGISVKDLAVSDIFYCSIPKNVKKATKVEVSAGNLDKFCALFRYSRGKWSVVEDAEVNEDGYLEFTATRRGAVYAVVIDASDAS